MAENKQGEIVPVKSFESLVYTIRGQQVMLDSDLAQLYGYEVKYLNRQVKRNIERFPEDFMFQITDEEVRLVWSQNPTANINKMSRTNPFVFSEQGVYMLATVLKSEIAVKQSIAIMRAFREMRHYIHQNQQFVLLHMSIQETRTKRFTSTGAHQVTDGQHIRLLKAYMDLH